VLSAGSGPSSPQTFAFLKLDHLGPSLGLGVASSTPKFVEEVAVEIMKVDKAVEFF